MRVVVVGAGINGLASAYHLARRGADVRVCERSTVGSGSTPLSLGGIRAQFSTEQNVRLSQESIEGWERISHLVDVDLRYRRPGYLFLARDQATADAFEANVRMQNGLGVPSRLLTPEEAVDHCHGLRAGPFRAATFAPTDGFADPEAALAAMRVLAEGEGVEILEHAPVTDLLVERGRAQGVELSDEQLPADAVVNAAGPWVAEVAAMAGLELPVTPKRRQTVEVTPEAAVPQDTPLTIDLDGDWHFRPAGEGRVYLGGRVHEEDPPQDPDDFRRGVEDAWVQSVLERARSSTRDLFGEVDVQKGWSGLYAVTPDHQPIIDEVVPGLVVAGGFSGHGFQHAPATGALVAELLLDQAASLVDTSPFQLQRFTSGRGTVEQNVA